MKKLSVLFGLFILSAPVFAIDGDAEAGKAKTATCAACHGPDGNSMIPMNPKIAGQHAGYLYKQLSEFKLAMTSGGKDGRNNAVMGGMAMPLSDQDMKDIAVYYAGQDTKLGETPEEFIELGEALYRGGDSQRGITACAACHGPDGSGMNLAGFPKLSGQHAEYTKTQLEMFRSGERANDHNGMMRNIAVKLTDADIEALSHYVSGLH